MIPPPTPIPPRHLHTALISINFSVPPQIDASTAAQDMVIDIIKHFDFDACLDDVLDCFPPNQQDTTTQPHSHPMKHNDQTTTQ